MHLCHSNYSLKDETENELDSVLVFSRFVFKGYLGQVYKTTLGICAKVNDNSAVL